MRFLRYTLRFDRVAAIFIDVSDHHPLAANMVK